MQIITILAVLTVFPFGAALLSIPFFIMFFMSKYKTSLTAGLLWLMYSIYEYLMYIRILCSGECNIRIDLLFIYPALLVASLISVIAYFFSRR
jgi:hypothetical protein